MSVSLRNTPHRYGLIAQALHWSIMLLVLVQLVLGVGAYNSPPVGERAAIHHLHYSLGITLFALMLARLGWRLLSPPPPLPPGVNGLQRLAANGTHVAIYVLLLAMPLVGWLYCSTTLLKTTWFGIVEIPNPFGPNARLAVAMKMLHMDMAGALVTLIVMHISAAVWHQFVHKDKLLARMLPMGGHEAGAGLPLAGEPGPADVSTIPRVGQAPQRRRGINEEVGSGLEI